MRVRALLRCVEYILWAAGALATGFCVGVLLETHLFQSIENKRLEEELRARRPESQTPAVPRRERRPIGSLVGRIEIARLGFQAVVLEGSDKNTLAQAVGHVPETAQPGEKGNFVLGGHRDTFFRPLKGIRDGDTIDVVTPSGNFQYAVEWTKVIDPSDTEVLNPTQGASLTLITCYPFYYIGPAPRRFIVRARQIDNRPATPIETASLKTAPEAATEPRPAPIDTPARNKAPRRASTIARNARPANYKHSHWR